MFNVRCGWIQHEAGHNSFATNTRIDKFIQTLTVGLGLSTSGYQWNKMHNKHHATPNKVNSDIDLDTLPLVAFFIGALEKNKRQRPVSALWLKLQALTFVPFTCGLVVSVTYIADMHRKLSPDLSPRRHTFGSTSCTP